MTRTRACGTLRAGWPRAFIIPYIKKLAPTFARWLRGSGSRRRGGRPRSHCDLHTTFSTAATSFICMANQQCLLRQKRNHLRPHAPEHAEHAAQAGHVHFHFHFLAFAAHQLSHFAVSHSGLAVLEPTALVNFPNGHFLWAMHWSFGQPINQKSTRKH